MHRPFLTLCLFASVAAGQAPAVQADANAPEMSSHDDAPTFQTKVNLVLVPVVVRDSSGRAVGNLEKNDFQLFDKGKPQVITKFSIERSATPANVPDAKSEPLGTPTPIPSPPAAIAQRFVIYLFDDLHLAFGDLVYVQKAAIRHLAAALQSSDRAAIITASGRNNLDFTDDHAKLDRAVMALRIQPLYTVTGQGDCPDLTYYMADQIQNKNDQTLLLAKEEEVMICANLQSQSKGNSSTQGNSTAQSLVVAKASQVLSIGQQDTRVSLSVVKDAIRRLSLMPGKRAIVFVSPGFVTPSIEDVENKTEIFDRAAQANVTISSIDARGLYTTNMDASKSGVSPNVDRINEEYGRQSALAEEDVLEELADGTGGTYFHNSNDLYAGFQRVAAAPEYSYLLGFSPQTAKADGTFHRLKVSLVDRKGLSVQARHGYFAPKHAANAEDAMKAELHDAVFSREVMHDLPVDLHTQFFKTGPADAKLTVLARVDLKRLHFRKQEGRNLNDLTVVSALFDDNGNFVTGMSKTLQMRLRDETLEKLSAPVTIKTSFDVKPGAYVVRLVVRDAQGHRMSAENGAVDIP